MKQENDHTYTLVLTVHNSPGVLVRCAQVFNRRGHNIERLHVESLPDLPHASSMTITAFGKPETIEQITMQLMKLVDVIDIKKENA